MKILIIDEELPYPLNSGKRLRTFNLLKHLAGEHKIIFVCRPGYDFEGDYLQVFENLGMTVHMVNHPVQKKNGLRFFISLFLNLFSSLPYVAQSHYSKDLEKEITTTAAREKVDLVHCEWTPYAVNMYTVFGNYPAVLSTHNIEAQIWQRLYENENNLFKKTYIYLQWKKMQRFEKDTFPKFNRISAVSENDRDQIVSVSDHEAVEVVENGVDTEYFSVSDASEESEPFSMVFTGSMDWNANIDGCIHFLDSIFPLILGQCPGAKLYIVGRNPSESLKRKAAGYENVILTGTVPDVRPYIRKSSAYIVPLRIGGGSRLKILEALAMQMAVVSTRIGAEGLELKNGEHVLLEDVPDLFAAKVIELFNNSRLRVELGLNGRRLVEDKYDWKILSRKMGKLWENAQP